MKNQIEFIRVVLYLLANAVIIASKLAGQSRNSMLKKTAKMDAEEQDK